MEITNKPNEYEATIDGQLAEIWSRTNTARAHAASALTSLAYASGAPMEYRRKERVCSLTTDELLAHAQAILDDPERTGRFVLNGSWTDKATIQERIDSYREHKAQVARCRAEAEPLEAIYEAKRWSRFFLVTNSNGHIHSSMSCSTCRMTTLFAWLPELSGLTEKDAVEAHGPHLCSVCFPTAPIEWRASDEAEADPNTCPGSGTYDHTDFRQTSYSGSGRGRCNHCHQTTTVTASRKLRKHKKASA